MTTLQNKITNIHTTRWRPNRSKQFSMRYKIYPCLDTVKFANLIWFSGSLHCRFLIPYQYSENDDAPHLYFLKLMTSQCIIVMLFVENVDYVTIKTVCTKKNLTVYLCFWSSKVIFLPWKHRFWHFLIQNGGTISTRGRRSPLLWSKE
jgi:hypothetical protein